MNTASLPAPGEAPGRGADAMRLLARVVIALWVPAVIVVCAYLLGGHLLTLPAPPPTDPRLASSVAALRGDSDRARWVVVHVLYEGCRCSRLVLDRLVTRRAASGTREHVVMVGGNDASAARARAAGFTYEALSREQLLERYGFEAAPVMVVVGADDRVRYLGGYTERKQSPALRDLDVLRRSRAGEVVAALPLFGCAVSARLQGAVDPLGLRR